MNIEDIKIEKMEKILRIVCLPDKEERINSVKEQLKKLELSTLSDIDILKLTLNNNQNNIIHYLCENNYVELTRFIFEKGKLGLFDDLKLAKQKQLLINSVNSHGDTGLHICTYRAKKFDMTEMVEVLLANGADPNVQNYNKETVTHKCSMNLTWNIFNLIKSSAKLGIRDIMNRRPYNVIGSTNFDASKNLELKKSFEDALKGTKEMLDEDDKLFGETELKRYLATGSIQLKQNKFPKDINYVHNNDKSKFFSQMKDGFGYSLHAFEVIVDDDKVNINSYLHLTIELKTKDEGTFVSPIMRASKDNGLYYFDKFIFHKPGKCTITVSLANSDKYKNIKSYIYQFDILNVDDDGNRYESPVKKTIKNIAKVESAEKSRIVNSSSSDEDEDVDDDTDESIDENQLEQKLREFEEKWANEESNSIIERECLVAGSDKLWEKVFKILNSDSINIKDLRKTLEILYENNGNKKITRMPLSEKNRFMNPLHMAIWWDSYYAVDLLLKYTNDVNGLTGEWALNREGVSALSIAAEYGRSSTIELLLTYPFRSVTPEVYNEIKSKYLKKSNINLDQYFHLIGDDDDDDDDDDDENSNSEFLEFNFPKDMDNFWSCDYIIMRNIFSKHEAIDPFPLLNIKDSMGETAIFYAIKGAPSHDKKFKCLRILMELSFLRIVNDNEQTLLHKIAEKIAKVYVSIEDLKIVIQSLVEYGVSKHKVDSQGFKAYEYQSDVIDFISEALCTAKEPKKTIKFSVKVEEEEEEEKGGKEKGEEKSGVQQTKKQQKNNLANFNKKRKLESTKNSSSPVVKIQKSSTSSSQPLLQSSSSSSSKKNDVSKVSNKYIGPVDYRCKIYEIVKQKVDTFFTDIINDTKDYSVVKDSIYDVLMTVNALVTFNEKDNRGILGSPQTLITNLKSIHVDNDTNISEIDEFCQLVAKLEEFDYKKSKTNTLSYETKVLISDDLKKLSRFISHFLCLNIYKSEFVLVSNG